MITRPSTGLSTLSSAGTEGVLLAEEHPEAHPVNTIKPIMTTLNRGDCRAIIEYSLLDFVNGA
jgi:hypothetical protein